MFNSNLMAYSKKTTFVIPLSLFIIFMMTISAVTGFIILSVANAAENNTLENPISETSYIIGRYFNTQPHKEDQIYIVNHTIVNGSLNEIKQNVIDAGVRINLSSMKNGMFQIDIPRNYPYSNQPWFEPFVIVNGYELLMDNDYSLELEECFYKFSIPFSNDSMVEIAFAHIPEPEPFISEDIPQHCVEKTIVTDSSIKVNLSYMYPLKQYKEGIKASEVMCRENLVLILKSTDNSPACVKPVTKSKLIERGWAKQFS